MTRSPASSGLLPMPGSPSSSWAVYQARLSTILKNVDNAVLVAFWLFGTSQGLCSHLCIRL
jgi:battenin